MLFNEAGVVPVDAEGRAQMAYYSKLDPSVYHMCRNCTKGNNIEAENLVEGQPPGAKLCDECEDKQRRGECVPGTPTPAR